MKTQYNATVFVQFYEVATSYDFVRSYLYVLVRSAFISLEQLNIKYYNITKNITTNNKDTINEIVLRGSNFV